METKSILKSKTMWLNLATLIVASATIVNPELLALIGVSPEAEPTVLKIVGIVVGAANMYLRKNTNTAVAMPTLTKEQPK